MFLHNNILILENSDSVILNLILHFSVFIETSLFLLLLFFKTFIAITSNMAIICYAVYSASF